MSRMPHHRTLVRALLPGVVLPGLIYFTVSRQTSIVIALVAASSVPLLDAFFRLARGKRPTVAGLVFIGVAGVSSGLTLWSGSPLFVLAKGAVISALLGGAFTLSAAIGRPLIRTVAVFLSTEHGDARRRLFERWSHPRALSIFRTLSTGWGLWLLVSAAEQAVLVMLLSPGMNMAVQPPLQAAATFLGIGVSILYVKRRDHPELGLLPARVRS
jgi:hypothetical protein